MLELKLLEQVAGFLVHVTRAFPRLKVYRNGLYTTMNSWRPDRDEEGWKAGDWKVDYDSAATPVHVKVLSRLGHDFSLSKNLRRRKYPLNFQRVQVGQLVRDTCLETHLAWVLVYPNGDQDAVMC